jgi:S1-C subfamily serine protease
VAAHTGLQAGDVVYEVAGTPITSAEQLRAAIAAAARTDKVTLGVDHRGKPRQLEAQF